MATLDAGSEVAYRPRGCGHDMQLNPQTLAEHAPRIAHAAAAVDGVADRNGVNNLTARIMAVQPFGLMALVQCTPQIGVPDLVPGDRNLDPCRPGYRIAAGQIDQNLIHRVSGHPLCSVHRVQDRILGRLQIDDGAAPDAVAGMLTGADDAWP